MYRWLFAEPGLRMVFEPAKPLANGQASYPNASQTQYVAMGFARAMRSAMAAPMQVTTIRRLVIRSATSAVMVMHLIVVTVFEMGPKRATTEIPPSPTPVLMTCVPASCGDGFVWNEEGGTEEWRCE